MPLPRPLAALLFALALGACGPAEVSLAGRAAPPPAGAPGQAAALQLAVDPQPEVDLHLPLSPAPEVQLVDAAGGPVARAGVAVAVAVGGGAGVLGGVTTRDTDAAGRARFDGLSFAGRAAGTRTLLFTSPGLTGAASPVVRVHPGPPAALGVASAPSQAAAAGAAVADPPAVLLSDADGNPIAGAAISFAVTAGGGAVAGSPASTGADGVARVGSWVLGASGPQALEATAAVLPVAPAVVFAATVRSSADRFDITLRYLPGTAPTVAQGLAFERARLRIEQVITGDLPSVAVDRTAAQNAGCGGVAIRETVDDLLILVELAPIDGAGGILGQAGPCFLRASSLPVVGTMQFDTADLAGLEQAGHLEEVILHEMLHVVGFGTVWPRLGLLVGSAASGGTNPSFSGAQAGSAFLAVNGGALYGGTPVPVEATGGAGTADGHWRESVFKNELMTGYLSGSSSPLSATTAASLGDLGYAVDLAQADPFDLATAALRAPEARPRPLGADLRWPIEVIEEGSGPAR